VSTAAVPGAGSTGRAGRAPSVRCARGLHGERCCGPAPRWRRRWRRGGAGVTPAVAPGWLRPWRRGGSGRGAVGRPASLCVCKAHRHLCGPYVFCLWTAAAHRWNDQAPAPAGAAHGGRQPRRGLHRLARPPAHLRQPPCDAGRCPQGHSGVDGSRHHRNDHEVRAPVARGARERGAGVGSAHLKIAGLLGMEAAGIEPAARNFWRERSELAALSGLMCLRAAPWIKPEADRLPRSPSGPAPGRRPAPSSAPATTRKWERRRQSSGGGD
jgi:hypothetical protein